MIKRIQIKDFKRLREIDINLDPYVNVFVGANGNGKTSIVFKAPQIILQNQNWSFSKVRQGCEKGEITLELDNTTITKVRTSKSTKTIIDGVDYRGKKSLQYDLSKLGFYPRTFMNSTVDLHFLKAIDIVNFLPKTPDGLYTKISSVYQFQHIIEGKKNAVKNLSELNNRIKFLDKELEILNSKREEYLVKQSSLKSELQTLKQLIELEDTRVKLVEIKTLLTNALAVQKELNTNMQEAYLKKSLQDLITIADSIDKYRESESLLVFVQKSFELASVSFQLLKVQNLTNELLTTRDRLNILTLRIKDQMESVEKCPTCGKILDS